MRHNYGGYTGLPIPNNLMIGMTLCEELHLVGNGCPYDGECTFDEDGRCLLEDNGEAERLKEQG